jgi:hypothetical protein
MLFKNFLNGKRNLFELIIMKVLLLKRYIFIYKDGNFNTYTHISTSIWRAIFKSNINIWFVNKIMTVCEDAQLKIKNFLEKRKSLFSIIFIELLTVQVVIILHLHIKIHHFRSIYRSHYFSSFLFKIKKLYN